jgi:hypothetical protein
MVLLVGVFLRFLLYLFARLYMSVNTLLLKLCECWPVLFYFLYWS